MGKPDYFLNHARQTAVIYLQKWIGHFYLWGGDDPAGFDCSGLICEVLKSVGWIAHKADFTADGLYQIFKHKEVKQGYEGCLVFWFKESFGVPGPDYKPKSKAIHVEMMVDAEHTVGASGGGSNTKTIQDAIKQNAFVKMRPLNYRDKDYKICDPFLKENP